MPDEPKKVSEEEAIAEVMRLGEELTRETRTDTLWYAKRISYVLVFLGGLFLVALFPYILLNKSNVQPVFLVLLSAFLIAAGVGGGYLGAPSRATE